MKSLLCVPGVGTWRTAGSTRRNPWGPAGWGSDPHSRRTRSAALPVYANKSHFIYLFFLKG
jgi:hypothetical protein